MPPIRPWDSSIDPLDDALVRAREALQALRDAKRSKQTNRALRQLRTSVDEVRAMINSLSMGMGWPTGNETTLWTTEETIAYLQIDLRTLYRYIEEGQLPRERIGTSG